MAIGTVIFATKIRVSIIGTSKRKFSNRKRSDQANNSDPLENISFRGIY